MKDPTELVVTRNDVLWIGRQASIIARLCQRDKPPGAVAVVSGAVLTCGRMAARRVLDRVWALLLGAILVLWSVGSIPDGPIQATDDPVSQGGEVGTLLARRPDGSSRDAEPDDDHDDSVGPPSSMQTRPVAMLTEASRARSSTRLRSVEGVGAHSPRGPPNLV